MPEGIQRDFREVFYWADTYARSGSDKRAIEEFIECETDEKVRSFRAQVYSIAQGQYSEKVLSARLGAARMQKHGSFEEWARLMMQWLAKHSKA